MDCLLGVLLRLWLCWCTHNCVLWVTIQPKESMDCLLCLLLAGPWPLAPSKFEKHKTALSQLLGLPYASAV